MIVSTTPAALEVSPNARPLIQNLGEATVYVGRSQTGLASDGIRLQAGDAYEFPEALVESGGQLWIVAATGTADVRVMNVG